MDKSSMFRSFADYVNNLPQEKLTKEMRDLMSPELINKMTEFSAITLFTTPEASLSLMAYGYHFAQWEAKNQTNQPGNNQIN